MTLKWVLVFVLVVGVPGARAQTATAGDASRNVEASAAGAKVDLAVACAELARSHGGLVDASGRLAEPAKAKLTALIAEWRGRGRRLWVLVAPAGTELAGTLKLVGGRLAPGELDAVVVASADGVRARLPALAGVPEKISEAFEASRRELTADMADGIVAFVRRLDSSVEERVAAVRRVATGMFLALGLLALGLLVRFARFRSQQRGWDRADAKDITRITGECQERLQRLSGAPGFDVLYAELQSLGGKPPAEAGPALERLRARLDETLARGAAR